MRAAGLKPIDTVVSSTAVLIKSRRPASPGNEKMVQLITERIKGVISRSSLHLRGNCLTGHQLLRNMFFVNIIFNALLLLQGLRLLLAEELRQSLLLIKRAGLL